MATKRKTKKPRAAARKAHSYRQIGFVAAIVIVVMCLQYAMPANKKPDDQTINLTKTTTSQTPTPHSSTPSPTSHQTPRPTQTPIKPTPKPVVISSIPKAAATRPAVHVVVPVPQSSVSSLVPTTTTTTPVPSNSASPAPTSTPSSGSMTSSYSSTNWSGYLATGNTFTGITGSWNVPDATGTGYSTSADATWIGIGGVTSSDLIQVGTQNTVSPSGHLTSNAFFELLPGASQTITSLTVASGDAMTASLVRTSGNFWTIFITDSTSGQTYTSSVTYASSLSSAEWIEEDPSYSNNRQIPFDNFGTTSFTNATSSVGESTVSIAASSAVPIEMLKSNGEPVATPSPLTTDGHGFSVTRENAG
jgi:hypothetical protein